MSSIIQPPSLVRCAGPLSRRGFMQFGLAGMATLSWPGLLRRLDRRMPGYDS